MANILVIAEHDGASLKPATLNAVTAASHISKGIGGDIHVLVAGKGAQAAAEAAAKVAGVAKVLLADDAAYEHQLPEDVAPLVVSIAKGGYGHVLAGATSVGKNLLPRVAALLDVAAISDITAVVSADCTAVMSEMAATSSSAATRGRRFLPTEVAPASTWP
jgi:electron transfer flavoprotein alpha subunit